MAISLSIGAKILGAVKTLFGLKDSLAKARIERRARMATLFGNIADCLEEVAKAIRRGVYPAGRCNELLTYATQMPNTVRDELGPARAEEIGDALKEAHEVEMLFGGRSSPEGQEEITKLDEAAGMLRALGNLVRV